MGTASRYFKKLVTHFRKKGGRSGAQHRLLAHPSREDVLHAFRLILGREPEDERAITAHMQISSVAELRRVLLSSEEFGGKYRTMHPDVGDHPFWSSGRKTIVFIHLQKTGGTSLREGIAGHFPANRRCPIFENKLHVLSLAELARYDFFAGHFDIPSLRFIPRDNVQVICLFRKPQARLVSFYRFLRSHPSGDEFANDRLIQLAHRNEAESFFCQPEIRAYSAINNHYTFALGRSFLWFDQHQDNLSHAVMKSVLLDAKLQISAMTALGLTEHFDDSVKLICRRLAIVPTPYIEKKHVTDQFANLDARFRRVAPVEITPRLTELMKDLIVHDDELYRFAVTEFESRLEREFGKSR